jgi:hypothetical protein
MHLHHLLSLPPAIIALCATSPVVAAKADSHQQQWPHNVPKHLKYFPEDEAHVKRGLSVAQRLQYEKPIGVKKMSLDEGEMFMLDNWIFAPESQQPSGRSGMDDLSNITVRAVSPLRPLAQSDWLARMHIRDVLLKRQFKCPDGTSSCQSIGAPDVCCGTGSNCITINGGSDAGNVGCCPKGQTCAGSVSCDAASGYTSCPGSSNGGCCLPGFKCQGVGCKSGTCTQKEKLRTVLRKRLTSHRCLGKYIDDFHPALCFFHILLRRSSPSYFNTNTNANHPICLEHNSSTHLILL